MPAFSSHPADRRFYATTSVVAAAVIVSGFANTYGSKLISGTAPVPVIIHVHAVFFMCWLVLFVAQTVLVVRGHVQAHMRLGQGGMVLAGLMLATGLAAAIHSARGGHKGIPGVEFPTPEGFLLLDVASVSVFASQATKGRSRGSRSRSSSSGRRTISRRGGGSTRPTQRSCSPS